MSSLIKDSPSSWLRRVDGTIGEGGEGDKEVGEDWG